MLSDFPSVFTPSNTDSPAHPGATDNMAVTLAPSLQRAPLEERTSAVQEVLVQLRDTRGLIPGWRDEVGETVLLKLDC